MRKTIKLFKILFNTTYGISSFKYKASKNKAEILKTVGLIVLIIFSLSPIVAGYTYYMNISYDGLAMLGQPGAIITMGVVVTSMLVLFFGFFYVVSTFYFTNDTEHLVSLPLRPSQIIGAKFGVIIASEYITELPLVLPPIIIFGIKSGAGLVYWIYSIIGILVIPIIPLCLASILSFILMRVVNLGKRKDLFTILGGVAAIALMLGVQMYIQRAAMSGDPEQIKNVLFSQNGIINIVARNFPPSAWISLGLSEYNNMAGLSYMLLFVSVSLAFLVAFEYLAEKLFLGGYLGSKEASSKRKRLGQSELEREIGARSKVSAIFWREFKILNRVPIFFMNCVLVVVLVPAIFLFMYFTTGKLAIGQITSLIGSSQGSYITTLVITGMALFTTAANMTPSTSLSREGAQFYISKYIPVSPKEQILGKALHSLALIWAGDILIAATLGFILNISVINIIISLVIAMAASIPMIEIGLMIDTFRPLLSWDNPQKAVKQNLNGIISMFSGILWAGGLLFLAAMFIPNAALAYIILILIFVVLGVVLYKVLMNYAEKRYSSIEL